jgi:RNA polymerase sigma-70 factor (ECF subfamily)
MEAGRDEIEVATWQAYRDALYRFALQRVGDAATAEDIVQDVLVKAYTQRETLKEPSKLRSWLYQITRNTLIDFYRTQKPEEPIPDDLAQKSTGGDEHARQEMAACLVPLLDTLPAPYRQALKLAEFEGARQREIATRMGLSLSGAKSRVQRGRRMLRDALLRCCRVELDHRGYALDYEVSDGCDVCSTQGKT